MKSGGDWQAAGRRGGVEGEGEAAPCLTLGALQAAVVSHGAEELKDEDGDGHH